MAYLKNLLIAADQFGNAVAVSARTGYFANIGRTTFRWWWQVMEWSIDWAFEPLDGPFHCYLSSGEKTTAFRSKAATALEPFSASSSYWFACR